MRNRSWIGMVVASILATAIWALGNASGDLPAPDDIETLLKSGNQRFVSGESTHPHADAKRRVQTSEQGQHPFATVITCSDSRVPVERVFDQGVGDLFVIRVAGNVCDTDEIGSVEYGVDHLETPVLVVLGHTHCGAVTAVVKGAELHGSIPALVDNIRPAAARAREKYTDVPENELIEHAVRENIWQSVEDLLQRSESARRRVQAGKLVIYGAMYDIETGNVKWYRSRVKSILKKIESAGGNSLVAEHAPESLNSGASSEHVSANANHPDPDSVADNRHRDGSIDKALTVLKEGNARFVATTPAHPHTDTARIAETASKGQHPFATVITCSDSRVPVERVFDQGVGDLFVIRVAGNVCDTDEIGSIEYGVDHLETPVLVVLGHTQCGAVTAVVKDTDLHGSIPSLVDNIRPAVERIKKREPNAVEHEWIDHAIEENVWQSVEDLLERSPSVRQRAADGRVEILGAIYDLASGKVTWLESRTLEILADATGKAPTGG